MRAAYCRHDLVFKSPAVTSRQTMTTKETYYIKLYDEASPDVYGIGECAIFRGLSSDDTPDYEDKLRDLCRSISSGAAHDTITDGIEDCPSLIFGVETAIRALRHCTRYGHHRPFPTPWSGAEGYGIEINGLVWMGDIDQMRQRARQKLSQGFRCIKLKVGGQNFEDELALVRGIRSLCEDTGRLEIRLDANGAFSPDEALAKLDRLAVCGIHSIEQPIRAGQWRDMARICRESPIPVALDEELIGADCCREALLDEIRPRYIILKPSLCGGFSGADEWIRLAEARGIGWWATSALESNVGLNAIAQWVSQRKLTMPQGLGTGALYVNNIESPLVQTGSVLRYDSSLRWALPDMPWVHL